MASDIDVIIHHCLFCYLCSYRVLQQNHSVQTKLVFQRTPFQRCVRAHTIHEVFTWVQTLHAYVCVSFLHV